MAFMIPETYEGTYFEVETREGTSYVPAPYFSVQEFRDLISVQRHKGTLYRSSAPGYLDCTEWSTEPEACSECSEEYDSEGECACTREEEAREAASSEHADKGHSAIVADCAYCERAGPGGPFNAE